MSETEERPRPEGHKAARRTLERLRREADDPELVAERRANAKALKKSPPAKKGKKTTKPKYATEKEQT